MAFQPNRSGGGFKKIKNHFTLALHKKGGVSVLPILYNCGFFYGLWVTYDNHLRRPL